MKTVKIMFVVGLLYLLAVFGGTGLMMYLDSQFYGEKIVHAKKVKKGEFWNKDTQTVIGPNGKEYTVKIIAYIPTIDDEPKLIRIHDPEFDVYCYTNQNDPYYMITGLNCYPKWILEGGNGK
jgi:hypothetical protein